MGNRDSLPIMGHRCHKEGRYGPLYKKNKINIYIYIYIMHNVYIIIYVPWSKVAILGMVIPPLIGILIMGI